MNKPVYLLPFIFVYKMVLFIFKIVAFIPKYSSLGFFFTMMTIITFIVNVIYKGTSLFLNGFIFLSFLVFKVLIFPFKKKPLTEKQKEKIELKRLNSIKKLKEEKEKEIQKEIEKQNKIEEEKHERILKHEALERKRLEKLTIIENKKREKLEEQDRKRAEKLRLRILKEEELEKKRLAEMDRKEKLEQERLERERIKKEQEEKLRLEKEIELKKKRELALIEKKKREELRLARKELNRIKMLKFVLIFVNFFRYYFRGFMTINYVVYKILKYILLGLFFPILIIVSIFTNLKRDFVAARARQKERESNKRKLKNRISKEEEKHKAMLLKRRKAAEKLAATERKKEEAVRKREEAAAKRKAEREKNTYINDKVQIEKKTIGDHINDALEKFIKLPIALKKKISDKYQSLSLVKNKMNQNEINREALLINFDGDDAVKSNVKILYEYVGKNPEGKVIKGYFEAFSKVEVHSFLLSEGYEVYSIRTDKWIQLLHGRNSVNRTKIKTKDLIFFLTQLSTYIKAGIPLVEALKILSRQFRQKSYQRIFKSMIYDLTMGDNFSTSLEKQGVAFPRILVNMVKASEMTGELPEVLDDMSEYFSETEKTRKQMITALIYPSIVFVMSIAVITFIIMFVVPKFVEIYKNMDASQIPGFTIFVINLSDFIETNAMYILIGIVLFLLTIGYLYKNVKVIRTMMQWLLMKTPVIGNITIYNEVTIFTKTFSSLLSHNVFITESMEVLNKITNNEIYKMLILDTMNNLAKGEKISKSFSHHWAFPVPAYEMLVTGERTGQLPEMMAKVAEYYQDLHKNAVTRLKSLIEPLLLVFLTFVVGGIILAVVIPMFSMFQMF